MTSVVLDVPCGDGTIPVTVTGLSRAEWAQLADAHTGGDLEAHLFAACVTADLPPEALGELFDDPDAAPVVEWCYRLSVPGSYEWAVRRMQANPRLAAEVAYCAAHGIPHSVFTGWDDRSQDLALAWHHTSRDVCPGCGAPAADMQDPDAWMVQQKPCVHCAAIHAAVEAVPDEHRHRVHTYLIPGGDD